MTLRQLCREFVIAKYRAEEDIDRDLVMAWTTAAFVRAGIDPHLRAKEMPNLKGILEQRRRGPLRQQTRLEAQATFYAIAARLGKTPKKVRLIPKHANA